MIASKVLNTAYFDSNGLQIGEKTTQQKISRIKRGATMIYKQDLEDIMVALASPSKIKIFFKITENIDSTGKLKISQADFVSSYNFSKSNVSKTFKILLDEKALGKFNNSIYLNPFVVVPPLNPHLTGSQGEAQKEWEKQIGYYEHKTELTDK